VDPGPDRHTGSSRWPRPRDDEVASRRGRWSADASHHEARVRHLLARIPDVEAANVGDDGPPARHDERHGRAWRHLRTRLWRRGQHDALLVGGVSLFDRAQSQVGLGQHLSDLLDRVPDDRGNRRRVRSGRDEHVDHRRFGDRRASGGVGTGHVPDGHGVARLRALGADAQSSRAQLLDRLVERHAREAWHHDSRVRGGDRHVLRLVAHPPDGDGPDEAQQDDDAHGEKNPAWRPTRARAVVEGSVEDVGCGRRSRERRSRERDRRRGEGERVVGRPRRCGPGRAWPAVHRRSGRRRDAWEVRGRTVLTWSGSLPRRFGVKRRDTWQVRGWAVGVGCRLS